MEAPIESDNEDSNDESICLLPEDLEEDEININIHFHCEHCIKLSKCTERSKPGWSCDIIACPLLCGIKFHACKFDEHEIMCPNAQVPCINASYGCPHMLQQKQMSQHLPVCPASVVVCNAEWNRWAIGARERERFSIIKGATSLYDPSDLDVAMALHDQKLVNELHSFPKEVRNILCNGITRRFPSLPISLHGSYREDTLLPKEKGRARSQSATDDDEDMLTPGLSLSVCTELLKGTNIIHEAKQCDCEDPNCFDDPSTSSLCKASSRAMKRNRLVTSKINSTEDDISAKCCTHGILKSICNFCRNDPEEPQFKFGKVWRQRLFLKSPGEIKWVIESRVEKVRKMGPLGIVSFKKVDSEDEDEDSLEIKGTASNRATRHHRFTTPPPTLITPEGLNLEMSLKRYSRHQVKPRAMFTFLCMQEVRRDQFASHYKNVHSEIQEGMDGWMVSRCPLHIIGCPYSQSMLNPGVSPADVIFSDTLHTFGVQPRHSKLDSNDLVPKESPKKAKKQSRSCQVDGIQMTHLPVELLQYIVSFLDGFSINNLSLTCRLLRDICYTLLDDKGLVIQEWVRSASDDKVSWKVGVNRWFFPKNFEHVTEWRFNDNSNISNHLSQCSFNNRHVCKEKFCYVPLNQEELQRLALNKNQ